MTVALPSTHDKLHQSNNTIWSHNQEQTYKCIHDSLLCGFLFVFVSSHAWSYEKNTRIDEWHSEDCSDKECHRKYDVLDKQSDRCSILIGILFDAQCPIDRESTSSFGEFIRSTIYTYFIARCWWSLCIYRWEKLKKRYTKYYTWNYYPTHCPCNSKVIAQYCFGIILQTSMQTLNNHLKKRLAQRFLGNQALGVLTLRFLHRQMPHIHPTAWYIHHHKLFVYTADQQTRIVLFAKKKDLLTQINHHLKEIGYSYEMRDIFCTNKKPSPDTPNEEY